MLPTGNTPDSFAAFIEFVFAADGTGQHDTTVSIDELLKLLEAAHRAGGFTRDVLLKHAPASFRGTGANANVHAFADLLSVARRATELYGYKILLPGTPGAVTAVATSTGVLDQATSRSKGPGIERRLTDRLGGGDVSRTVTALDDLRATHGNWMDVAAYLSSLPGDQQIVVKGPTLAAIVSTLQKKARIAQGDGHGAE